MAKDVKKKNASKKTVKVQKESTKVNIEKVEDTKKQIKNEVKPVKKETKKVKKQTPKKSYSSEVKAELKKVNWPSKKDLTKYGVATIIFIVIFGLYFYGLDALFAWLSSLVKGL
mgnify:CR=1 FL=1